MPGGRRRTHASDFRTEAGRDIAASNGNRQAACAIHGRGRASPTHRSRRETPGGPQITLLCTAGVMVKGPSGRFSPAFTSAKPRAMNRTGLVIALGLALVTGLLFGIFPELDLKLAALFYDAASTSFPLKQNELAAFARDAAMWIAWALALPALIAIVVKLVRPDRPMLIPGRAAVFLLVTILLSAVVLTNLTFKSYWGRPRPVVVTEFNGPWEFMPWWDPRGECGRNCSFFSGEGATAFWTYAPAALTPPTWRPLAYVAATLFGVTTSVLRMAFGGHFFTDVAAAGLVSFLVIWLCYAWIYRWPSTRRTDEQIEAALARWGWPGYRLWQRWRGREVG
jgi:lipid A 4'-phosphatase